MGCCVSSPHARRRYLDPADLDEEYVDILPDPSITLSISSPETAPTGTTIRLRTFGRYRPNGVWVPDDIDGLPSSKMSHKLASPPDILLYEAEIDNGKAWSCLRPCWCITPFFPFMILQIMWTSGFKVHCDEICCWVRKEYSTRTYYRIYPNRIEVNNPYARFPFGLLGCGSWTGDAVASHPFDRGAFGFRRVQCGVLGLVCCVWPMFGDVVARQRCQCNGSVWYSCADGWWCDEWPCDILCCTFRYVGLADGDETAMASNIALQAYFEGRTLNQQQMEACLEYWRRNVSEMGDPIRRRRKVLCEDVGCVVRGCIPSTVPLYKAVCQCPRRIPPRYQPASPELIEVYDKYETLRQRQIARYRDYKEPIRQATLCRKMGCRRVFGRRGLCFCTEGCCCDDHPYSNKKMGCCYKKLKQLKNEDPPFPPYVYADWDDDNNAAKILQIVLGNPPRNVVFRKWHYDPETQQYHVVTSPTVMDVHGNNATACTLSEEINGLDHKKKKNNNNNNNKVGPAAATTTTNHGSAVCNGHDNQQHLVYEEQQGGDDQGYEMVVAGTTSKSVPEMAVSVDSLDDEEERDTPTATPTPSYCNDGATTAYQTILKGDF